MTFVTTTAAGVVSLWSVTAGCRKRVLVVESEGQEQITLKGPSCGEGIIRTRIRHLIHVPLLEARISLTLNLNFGGLLYCIQEAAECWPCSRLVSSTKECHPSPS